MTPYQQHKAKWVKCQRCPLCDGRRSVVLARGHLPADVVFVGEAPGESEDVLGKPFVGPAGKLMDQIIVASVPPGVRYALTNLVACIPREEDGGKATEPPREAIKACAPRLVEFLGIARPKLLVLVGTLAAKHAPKIDVPAVAIVHPAFLLRLRQKRSHMMQEPLSYQQAVVTISDAVEDYVLI